MNKKQVNALLKVMGKDAMRPGLMCAGINQYDGHGVLVATNGYALVAAKVGIDLELVGKVIKREAIERWYKLATGRDRLDGASLAEIIADKSNLSSTPYPVWQGLVPSPSMKHEPQAGMKFDAELAKVLQDVNNGESLTYTLYGKLSPMVARNEMGTFVLMPIKQK